MARACLTAAATAAAFLTSLSTCAALALHLPASNHGGQHCEKVVFLRIQKTGSTSFGEDLLPRMCQQSGQSCGRESGLRHLDYNEATRRAALDVKPGTGCPIALLRDPVERTLSEFFMLWNIQQGPPQYDNIAEEQWDVYGTDVAKLRVILQQSDVAKAFLDYLYFEANPSRNRQTMYLLGFNRVGCKDTLGCTAENESTGHGYPGHQFDWDKDSEELLERAKTHLRELTAFGISDCFEDSVESIAREVGWDHDTIMTWIGESNHWREQDPSIIEKAAKLKASPSQELSETMETDDTGLGETDHASWTSMVSKHVAKEIRTVNSVDVELLKYARELFQKNIGKECPKPS